LEINKKPPNENTIIENKKSINKENFEVVKFLFSSKLSSSKTTILLFLLKGFKPVLKS
tara:strand:- start:118 stop:291 length:174 start_codon:yes stop_codon:yes gene_type:complete